MPSGLAVDLVLDPNQALPSSLSRVEGYVYVLYAEEIIEADIPFEVSGEWIEATEDLQISVCPQTPPPPGPIHYEAIPGATGRSNGLRPTSPVALWKYETRVHSTTGGYVLPLLVPWGRNVSVGRYVVIKTQLVEADTWFRDVSEQWAYMGFSGDCFCSGQVEQGDNDYDSIRHVIAVRPVEVKVPFVLTNIPIPAF